MEINDFGVKLINIKDLSRIDGGKNPLEWYVGYMYETYSIMIDNAEFGGTTTQYGVAVGF